MQSLQGRSAAHEAKVLEAAGVFTSQDVTGLHAHPGSEPKPSYGLQAGAIPVSEALTKWTIIPSETMV